MSFEITKHITAEEYYTKYAKYVALTESETELVGLCPFHGDRKKSFSINRQTGLWVCFGKCGVGGNIIQYHARLKKMTEDEATQDLKITLGLEKVVPEEKVADNHARLLKAPQILDFLKKRRGLTLEVIKKYSLGFDGDRIWIPVKVGDHYLNARRYAWRPGEDAKSKMLSYDVGFGEARLYPHDNLQRDEPLLICEGEMDALLANTLGYNAVSVTGGAGTWTSKFTSQVAGKVVYLCYDIDAAGTKGAEKVAKAIGRVVRELRIVHLPITEPANGDFTDYIVGHGFTKKDFDELIEKTEIYRPKEKEANEIDPTVYNVTLADASSDKYFMKTVEIPVIVSGKDLAPFFVPHVVKFSCGMGLKKCGSCGLGPNGANGEYRLEISHPADILKMIDVPESVQNVSLKQKAGIIPCNLPSVVIESAQNVEQVRVIPEIEFSTKTTEYVTRDIFVLGQGVKTNTSYTMRGVTIPDPKTQYATQLIQHVEASQLSIDQFKMTPELRERLAIFQPGKHYTIKQKLAEIHEDITTNVTQIYQREDIQRVIDLVYHSVIQFKFLGRLVTKGWSEGLVIGDTRCGKSETIERMLNHYKCGELISGENTTFAGLVGGIQEVQGRRAIGWGKIPLNDRRLIAIDEASGLNEDQISLMSGIRSSGIAEIVKIQAERTNARTRLLWFSNPRSGRRLDSYNYGVLAIKELIGRVEDIARFDIAATAASGEVSSGIAFEMKDKKVKHVFTSELCNLLVMWSWSRHAEHVKIGTDTEKAIYDAVNVLDAKYSSIIPLVEPSEQRIKLARMSVSLACRLFSTSNGEDVIVTPAHVAEVLEFLQACYDKPSMAYSAFSRASKKTDDVDPKELKAIALELREFRDWTVLRDTLLEMAMFKKNEISDIMGYDMDMARELFKWMGKRRLIRSAPFGFVKHAAFTALLKSMVNEKAGPEKVTSY